LDNFLGVQKFLKIMLASHSDEFLFGRDVHDNFLLLIDQTEDIGKGPFAGTIPKHQNN